MKRSTLLVTVLMVVFLFECFIVVGDCSALGCARIHYKCFNKKTGAYVGKDTVRQCWSWKLLDCAPCYCHSEPFETMYCHTGYEAVQCNKDYPQCNGQCCMCRTDTGQCYGTDCNDCIIPNQ
jgi:hypothetical protein